jgi:hypothetical protein
MGRRIDIEANDVGEFGGKARVRMRCGCRSWARHMRCTERSEIPIILAIARPIQWVAWWGGSVQVSATSRAAVSAAIGALPGLGVRSRTDLRPRPRQSAVATATLSAGGPQCCAPPAAPTRDRLCGVDNHTSVGQWP